MEEATATLAEHAKIVHNYTDEQLSAQKPIKAVKKQQKSSGKIKKETLVDVPR